MLSRIFGNKAATDDAAQHNASSGTGEAPLTEDQQSVKLLFTNVEVRQRMLERAKAEADRCLANPSDATAQERLNALLSERECVTAHHNAVRAYAEASSRLELLTRWSIWRASAGQSCVR